MEQRRFPPEPLAHVSEDGRTQPLSDHLRATAERAAEMAVAFGSSQWAYLAGLWHDLGKFSPHFQDYIRATGDASASIEKSKAGRVDHSTAGGLLALEMLGDYGQILAYAITGHHAGLPDWEADTTGRASLSQRLKDTALLELAKGGGIPGDILDRSFPAERPTRGSDPALWIRLLFSCVVDADFLDTEEFLDPGKSAHRAKYENPAALLGRLVSYLRQKQAEAPATKVNRIRGEVLARCVERSAQPPGIFTLTVPTGGGKTLSSMAFGLGHAVRHGKRRVIYVIPYTSIIEQTAAEFRKIFGEQVIEHQSNLDVSDETKDTVRSRLACENWDAPIIVTTSVQFFESLFASRSSRCRKLHNIVNSVVVLDEAQLLPIDFLNPILLSLKELSKNYGVTVLLMTATMPALGSQPSFQFPGLPGAIELMEDPMGLHAEMKRVDVSIPDDLNKPWNWEDLATELRQHQSVLCIVNRRDDCRALWEKMPEGTFHLSALMCGAHRSARIAEIKARLEQGLPTRVISTQLVEAGVDLDFPVVYRALAGLDSVAQAAGRCNREGRPERGTVVVFVPPSQPPPGYLRQAADVGRRILSRGTSDILAPDEFEAFFRELYWLQGSNLDRFQITADLRMNDFRCSFRSAAAKFHIIDEAGQAPVIVLYGEGAALATILERTGPERWLMRKLQRYVVNLPRWVHDRLLTEGGIRELYPGIFVQGHANMYDPQLGFCPDRSVVYGPDELIQ